MTKTLDFDGCDFGHFGELIFFMEKVQRLCSIEEGELYGSVKGILYQFKQFNLPEELRDKDEIMIVYYVPKWDTDPAEFQPKIQWFDKNTKKAIEEPKWFQERKTKLEEAAAKRTN